MIASASAQPRFAGRVAVLQRRRARSAGPRVALRSARGEQRAGRATRRAACPGPASAVPPGGWNMPRISAVALIGTGCAAAPGARRARRCRRPAPRSSWLSRTKKPRCGRASTRPLRQQLVVGADDRVPGSPRGGARSRAPKAGARRAAAGAGGCARRSGRRAARRGSCRRGATASTAGVGRSAAQRSSAGAVRGRSWPAIQQTRTHLY